MAKQVCWLSDAEWQRIEPLLLRGRRAHRVDDRWMISGIVHMLRCGARWRNCFRLIANALEFDEASISGHRGQLSFPEGSLCLFA